MKALVGFTVSVADMTSLSPYPPPEQISVYVKVPVAVGVTLSLPLPALLPPHAPLAVQAAAFELHVTVALWPSVIVMG